DFNNILGTIIGYAEMMDIFDVAEDSPLKPQISEILGAAERARNLVRQILTFSRQTEKEPIRTSLIPLVKEAMVFLRASLPSTIRFEVDVPREAGEVMADPTQIYQMLMNLCTNASHSMREKGGTLTVALEEEDIPKEGVPGFPEARPGTAVRLTVTDTGEGIPAEALENIFDPYYTTREGGDGAGLGLAVVHGIVTGHGGAIRVESELDGGTSFSVYLPRIADQGAGAGKSTGDGRKSLLPTGTESILFVDDEDPLCNWGRMILSRLGYQVDCETAGERALDLVLRDPEKYDLIITDETMPGMQGSVLAEKLLESKSGIPVILCSGHGSMMNIADYREKGVARLLAKPLGARVLADVVRQVLDESKIQGARE
ncbi:MAG: ATP-binding protein, partial [Pseudomonadota bacterium]